MTTRIILRVSCLAGALLVAMAASQAEAQAYAAVPAGVGYAPSYAPYPYNVYNPRRAYRQALRYGYPPLYQHWPAPVVVVDRFGYPMYGPVNPPLYGRPQAPAANSPQPAPTSPPSTSGGTPASPELIPAPAADAGTP
jgi:hypothetical protein